MQESDCPSAGELTAFLLGEFPEERCQPLRRHLGACSRCEELTQELERRDDPFVQAIRLGIAARDSQSRNETLSKEGAIGHTGTECHHAPKCVAGYTVLEELGRGGMGVVYKARQARLGRLVALKMILHGSQADEVERARFSTEAKAIARLPHPNFVQVYEVGEDEGKPFFSLEFCGRGTLGQKLNGAPLGPVEAAQLVQTLARAMQTAHDRNIIHRDLKPSNVLFSDDGTPKISDFGLAKKLDDEGQTVSGALLGTPSYMSPEQAAGNNQTLGPACDIYSLGAVLYECLTGRPPFKAATAFDTMSLVLGNTPAPVRQLQPNVARDLETICLKCLEKSPARRYTSALALAEDLRRYLAGEPIAARPVSWLEHVWRWCTRNPGWAAMIAIVAVSLLVVALGGMVMNVQLQSALTQSEDRRVAAVKSDQARKEQLFEALLAAAQAKRFSQRAGQRFAALEAIRQAVSLAHELDKKPETFSALRQLAIAALALPDYGLSHDRVLWPPGSYSLNFDDLGELYAHSDDHGNVKVRSLADDRAVAYRPGNGSGVALSFGHDAISPFLLIGDDPNLLHWRFQNRPPEKIGIVQARDSQGWHITADRQLLVAARTDGSFPVYDLPTGKLLRTIRFGKWDKKPQAQGHLIWDIHPFAHQLAVCMGPDLERQTVRVIDLDDGHIQELDAALPGDANYVSWHRDGTTLAISYAQSVALWDVPSERIYHRITDHKGGGLIAQFNATGELLCTQSTWAGGVRVWHPYSHKPLLNLPELSSRLTYFPLADGRAYCYTRQDTRFSMSILDPAREFRTLVRHPLRGVQASEYRHGSVHKEGRLLAVGTTQGVSLFDLATGLDVGHLGIGHNWSVHFIAETGELLTYGQRGLFRWPVQTAASPGLLRLGPPARIDVDGKSSDSVVTASRDGSAIAAAQFLRAVVVQRDQPGELLYLRPIEQCRQQISISPDGRWVAVGQHEGVQGDVRIWDSRTAKIVKTLDSGIGANPCFSPDGQWLHVQRKKERRLWRSESWQEVRKDSKPNMYYCAFSPDSHLIAGERGDGTIRLEETAGGNERAILENPFQARSPFICFSPDGTLLITINSDMIHVWDLRKIRVGLAALGLDWEGPAYPPEPLELRRAGGIRPLKVQVVGIEATLSK